MKTEALLKAKKKKKKKSVRGVKKRVLKGASQVEEC